MEHTTRDTRVFDTRRWICVKPVLTTAPGINASDVIIAVDGVTIGCMDTQSTFFQEVHLKPTGTLVTLTVLPAHDYTLPATTVAITLATVPAEIDWPLNTPGEHRMLLGELIAPAVASGDASAVA